MSDTARPHLKPVEFDPFAASSGPFALTEPQREMCAATLMGDEANCVYNQCFVLRLRRAARRRIHCATRSAKSSRATTRCGFRSIWRTRARKYSPRSQSSCRSSISPRAMSASARPRSLRIVDRETHTPFDLAKAPLWRAELMREAPDRHVLVFTAHHSSSTAGRRPSSSAIFRDATRRIDSASGRRCRRPPRIAISWTSSQSPAVVAEMDAALEYWAAQYATRRADVRAAAGSRRGQRSRPTPPGGRFSRSTAIFTVPCARRPRNRARRRSSRCWLRSKCSSRGSRASRISIVGVPMASQALQDNGHLVAHGVNTIPLRCHVDPQHSVQPSICARRGARFSTRRRTRA